MRIDHVALEVGDFDARLSLLTERIGLQVRRHGHLRSDPSRRVVMLADERGVKVELVEGPASGEDRMLHLAFETPADDAVDAAFDELVGAGCSPVAEPSRFDPAQSRTATVAIPDGGLLQLVNYDPDSPDAP